MGTHGDVTPVMEDLMENEMETVVNKIAQN